jgi:rhodanese-related sulfurtransferase
MAYAEELRPTEAWEMLKVDPGAQLVDVRTRPEWDFVGVPDLTAIGKRPAFLSWQVYPDMRVNPTFTDELRRMVPSLDAPLLFLCRSGTRSHSAAEAMATLGYRRCYNISEGFEGRVDDEHHRGRKAGWKAAGLPWIQE